VALKLNDPVLGNDTDVEFGTTPPVTVTVFGKPVNAVVGVPEHTPLVKRLYVSVPAAEAVALVRGAESNTAMLVLTEVVAAPFESNLIVVVMLGWTWTVNATVVERVRPFPLPVIVTV
jgi:hypothetical protein